MRKLILVTASALMLGLAGCGGDNAADVGEKAGTAVQSAQETGSMAADKAKAKADGMKDKAGAMKDKAAGAMKDGPMGAAKKAWMIGCVEDNENEPALCECISKEQEANLTKPQYIYWAFDNGDDSPKTFKAAEKALQMAQKGTSGDVSEVVAEQHSTSYATCTPDEE